MCPSFGSTNPLDAANNPLEDDAETPPRRRRQRQMGSEIEVRTAGGPSPRFAAAYEAVFGDHDAGAAVDLNAWRARMHAGRSWAIASEAGFLAAHERVEEDGVIVVNVWLMGVREEARGSGAFGNLVGALLGDLARSRGPWRFVRTELTMTTRPEKFAKMFAILQAVGARRCDLPEDTRAGKARFRVPVLAVALALWRRRVLAACAIGGAIGAAIAVGVALSRSSPRSASLE